MTSPTCSSCGKGKNEVQRLIQGGATILCNGCILRYHSSLVAANDAATREKGAKLPTPREIITHLDQYVIGQEDSKKKLAVSLYHHYKLREYKGVVDGVEVEKNNVLIYGPSGTGKTLLIRTAARILNVPCFVGDATRLTSAGYVGDDVETLLQGLLQDANYHVEKAQWGIVVVDEIDKIRRFSGRGPAGYKDVSGETVQQALLKIIEGGTVTFPARGKVGETVTMDTTHILFIFLGSFAGIEEVVAQRVKKASRLGFSSSASQVTVDEEPSQEDFIDFGMIPEFMGRVPVRTSTRSLTVEEIRRAFTEPRNSILAQMTALFKADGLTLTFTPEAVSAVAQKAFSDPTGVRSLRKVVTDLLFPLMVDLPARGTELVITEDMIHR